jgi:uncharacterized protein YcfJ
MRNSLFKCAAVLIAMAMLTGCATKGESAGLGAVLGGVAGAVIGHQSGRGAEGAVIGAAIGGLSGLAIQDVRETNARKRTDAAATAQQYNYRPAEGLSLTFEDGAIDPGTVSRGTFVEASMQYALLGAGVGKQVTETRIVRKDDEVVSQISSKKFTRNDGTWVSNQQFKVPNSWKPGEYVLEQTVQTIDSTVFGTTRFYVQ